MFTISLKIKRKNERMKIAQFLSNINHNNEYMTELN